jgi:hypothetical protein
LGGVYPALVQTLSPEKWQQVDTLCSRIRLATKLSVNNNDELVWPAFIASLDAQAKGSATGEENVSGKELVDPSGKELVDPLMPDEQRQLDVEYPVKNDAPVGSSMRKK